MSRDLIDRVVEELLRRQMESLEEQGRTFVKMGYDLSELTVVAHDDGSKEVSPISCLPVDSESSDAP